MSTKTAEAAPKSVSSATQFVHLHNHGHYSLLDGLQKVPQMLDRAKELGMNAIAMTDHGTLSGIVEFYSEAKKRDIKPIIGLEAYVAPRRMHDKTGKADANPYHLILLAKNQKGYQNLMRLSTKAHLEGFYYKPRVDRELLEELHEGIIALSGCASGEVARHILNGAMDEAQATIEWYRDTFGKDNYYLELQDHEEWEPQIRINKALIELSKKTGVPLVVTADSHYTCRDDREAHEILLCVQTGKTIGDTDRMEMDMALFISPPEEIAKRWEHVPEAVSNTVKIAEACEVELELGKILIPTFPTPDGKTEKQYLHELCWQGMMWRYGDIPKEDMHLVEEAKARKQLDSTLIERLDYELEVIDKMGYEGYFLIVADFINWGKNQGIIFGPGRGSAAGSIVAYVMNITDLDPMKYDLLFERFLNPDRISMPDIDIDIQDTRRGEVIDYVTEKYGQDRVAQIITFGTMAARNAVRDTGRALGMSYAEVDAIAKKVPQPVQGRHIPLKKSVVDDPELREEYNSNPRAKNLIDLAQKLEGTIRSNGVHAAGVVIAPDEIVKFIPLQRAQKGGICTQYSMNPVEDLGLLKMDFLGLSNLTIINDALRIIKKVYGKNIDIADIPLDDPKTYELFSRGDTTGVFQLESAGMKRYLKALQPSKFDDIVAMVALYRPGPMQFIDDFIDRKHGRKEVRYDHPGMEAALGNTYGILVYQEQFMQISKDMCGFTGGQADTLRKAIGKKKRDVMAKMKTAFIDGMVEHSQVSQAFAEKFWGQLEAFADYCFNKSHSACYALIAVWTAYLKANYPSAFMAALMTSNSDNIDKISMEINECRRMGIKVLPPDVNHSFLEFSVMPETNDIRFGLSAVKNLGVGPIEAIIAARETKGSFKTAEDFAKRVNAQEVNRKGWEALIKVGAMDSFGAERGTLLYNLDTITGYASKAQKHALSGQIDIFGSLGMEDDMPGLRLDIPPTTVSNREQLAWEKELIGLYLSSHPLDDYAAYLNDKVVPLGLITGKHEGKSVQVGGLITTVRKITTKNNAMMAFVGIEDKSGDLELIVFPKAYEKNPELWQPDTVVEVNGKINTKDRDGKPGGEIKIMVDEAKVIDYDKAKAYKPSGKPNALKIVFERSAGVPKEEVEGEMIGAVPLGAPELASVVSEAPAKNTALMIKLNKISSTEVLTSIKTIIAGAPGTDPVFLIMPGEPPKKIKLPVTVQVDDDLISRLKQVVNEGVVARATYSV
ncbi:DNA polymerase III subunit alpha [Patescibacteria group bacterium]|nr:MAG: DNA polymerase III subunit alpha [Patescibacteria group bacterium]